MKELLFGFESFKANIKSVLVFAFLLIITLSLNFIFDKTTFSSLGGVFLRVGNIPYAQLIALFGMFAWFIITIYLISVSFVGISLVVKEGRLSRIRKSLFEEMFYSKIPKVFVFFLFLFVVLMFIQMLFFVYSIPSWVFVLISFALTYLTFFIPYAMVIDDYDLPLSIEKGISFLLSQPLLPFIWSVVGVVLLSFSALLLSAFLNYETAKIISVAVNALFIAPYMIIFGAHLYLKKYPMSY